VNFRAAQQLKSVCSGTQNKERRANQPVHEVQCQFRNGKNTEEKNRREISANKRMRRIIAMNRVVRLRKEKGRN